MDVSSFRRAQHLKLDKRLDQWYASNKKNPFIGIRTTTYIKNYNNRKVYNQYGEIEFKINNNLSKFVTTSSCVNSNENPRNIDNNIVVDEIKEAKVNDFQDLINLASRYDLPVIPAELKTAPTQDLSENKCVEEKKNDPSKKTMCVKTIECACQCEDETVDNLRLIIDKLNTEIKHLKNIEIKDLTTENKQLSDSLEESIKEYEKLRKVFDENHNEFKTKNSNLADIARNLVKDVADKDKKIKEEIENLLNGWKSSESRNKIKLKIKWICNYLKIE